MNEHSIDVFVKNVMKSQDPNIITIMKNNECLMIDSSEGNYKYPLCYYELYLNNVSKITPQNVKEYLDRINILNLRFIDYENIVDKCKETKNRIKCIEEYIAQASIKNDKNNNGYMIAAGTFFGIAVVDLFIIVFFLFVKKRSYTKNSKLYILFFIILGFALFLGIVMVIVASPDKLIDKLQK